MQTAPVSVLDRILAIIEAVRESGGAVTVADVARATRIPKSTASRTVAELVARGYLERTGTGVVIGIRLFEFGARASTPRRLVAAARPVLAELFYATGEHLNVAVNEGTDMVSLISVRGRLRPPPSTTGAHVPAATTALGKAVLAFTSDQTVVRGITSGLDSGARFRLSGNSRACAPVRWRSTAARPSRAWSASPVRSCRGSACRWPRSPSPAPRARWTPTA